MLVEVMVEVPPGLEREQLIADYNLDITTYKYRSKNENFHHQLLSHNSLRIVLRKKLETSFLEE